jgi:hypothetical protein
MNNIDHLITDEKGKIDFDKAILFLPPNKLYNINTGERKPMSQMKSIIGQTISRLNISEDFIINNLDDLNMTILILNRLVTDKVFETSYDRVYKPIARTLTNGGYIYFNQLMMSVKEKENKIRILKDLLNAFYSRKNIKEREYVKRHLEKLTGLKVLRITKEEE